MSQRPTPNIAEIHRLMGEAAAAFSRGELQRAAMGNNPDSLVLSGRNNADIGCPDALRRLQQRFAAWWGGVERITLPGGQGLGIPLLDLGVRQTLPVAKSHLPQTRFSLDAQSMRHRNYLGRLPGPLQVAGIEQV